MRTAGVAATTTILLVALVLLFTGSEAAAGGAPTARDSAAGASAERAVRPRPPKRAYWGAWIGNQFTGHEAPQDMNAVAAFQQVANKPLSLIEWSLPWADCTRNPCNFFPFPTGEMQKVRNYGAIPFISWASSSLIPQPDKTVQPDFQLSDILSGRYDEHIRNWATAARNWGHPFFLRFNWEMDGDWFAWGVRANGNRIGEFVPAWRHVQSIFNQVGATNATWVWCPYVDTSGRRWGNIRAMYPGSAWVDWTCLDGYNWGRGPTNPHPVRSFNRIFADSYRRITTRVAPRKPMILAELATSDFGVNKGRWINNMFTALRKGYRKVRGLIYYNVNDRGTHWPIEQSVGGTASFRRGIAHRRWKGNGYANITASPIFPPR
jgi:hypothetical protein